MMNETIIHYFPRKDLRDSYLEMNKLIKEMGVKTDYDLKVVERLVEISVCVEITKS